MLKTIKKVLISIISILFASFLLWLVLFFNPNLSYAKQTQFDKVTIFHNQNLEKGTAIVIKNAIQIIKKSELYNEDLNIQLCLNDDKIYPNLHPFVGEPLAFAIFDKTIVKNCKTNFNENVAEARWAINNNELRKFDLTYLLAHEFTHNLQWKDYVDKTKPGFINWKLEGYADYIAREYQQDGKLIAKIEKYLSEESKEHIGFPVFELEDGTKQILSYYKYALVVQYLMEIKHLKFDQIYKLEQDIDQPYSEMIEWSKK